MFRKLRYLSFAYLSLGLAKLLFVRIPPVISVTGIIKRDGEILCVDLSYYDGLGLPGGVVEGNEEPVSALSREITEETGLTMVSCEYLGTASAPFRGISCLSLVYEVRVTGEQQDSNEGNLVWIDPDAAISKLQYPNARLAVSRYLDGGF